MRKVIIFILTIWTSWACKQETLSPYSGKDFIYFNETVDSTVFSYAYVDGAQTVDTVSVWIRSGGQVVDYDREVKIRIKETNGAAGVDFNPIPTSYTMAAGTSALLVSVEILRPEALKTEERFLILELEESKDFKLMLPYTFVGSNTLREVSNTTHKILFSEIMTAPVGWNVADFGDFSVEKLNFMCEMLNMTRNMFNDAQYMLPRRTYIATKIAQILMDLDDKGQTIYESDGITPMRMAARYH